MLARDRSSYVDVVLPIAGILMIVLAVAWRNPDAELLGYGATRYLFLSIVWTELGLAMLAFGVMRLRRPALTYRWLRTLTRPASLLAAILVAMLAAKIVAGLEAWESTRGAEYLIIAKNLSAGHGFSLNASTRWYFNDIRMTPTGDTYMPTALEEPLYPYLLGAALALFGEHGKLWVLIAHVLAHVATCVALYQLMSRAFGQWTGLLTAGFLVIFPPADGVTHYFSPAPFAGLFAVIALLFLFRGFDRPTLISGAALGVSLGLGALSMASLLVLIPLFVLSLVLCGSRRHVAAGLVAAGASMLVIAPWTVRNWVEFDEFVPVRVGFGLISHQATPTLAGTFLSGDHACTGSLGPLWEARGPFDAVRNARIQQNEWALYTRSFRCIEDRPPPGYDMMNEAQRDQVYLARTVDFLIEEPVVSLQLFIAKMLFFFSFSSRTCLIASFLALPAAFLYRHDRRVVLMCLSIFLYAVPYGLGMPWDYRYRYPVEPFLLALASLTLTQTAWHLARFVEKARSSVPPALMDNLRIRALVGWRQARRPRA